MKAQYKKLLIVFTLFIVLPMSLAQASPANLADLKLEITRILVETNVPAIGIALVEDGKPVWVEGLGTADLEKQVPADKDTIFRMGSVSKMFAGVAVMQLVDHRRLSLDDKLADILPEFVFENPWEDTHPVRIAHLLEHTTGWDVHMGEYSGEAPDTLSLEDGLNSHTDSRVSRWIPGTRQTYSNTGPVVAALAVEKITGMSFEAYTQKYIFDPLNMPSTSFFKTQAYEQRGATNYTPKGPAEYLHIFSRPSSSLNTSPSDFVNFLAMFVNRGQSVDQTILSGGAVDRMEKSETTLGFKAGIEAGYGLTVDAFGFENWNMPFYGHTGGLPGAVSELIYQPELNAGYVFMINQENRAAFDRLSRTLKEYLLRNSVKDKAEVQVISTEFRGINGFYTPVNPIFELGRIQFDIANVMRMSSDDMYLHRSPFWGGWTSNDYAPKNSSGEYLVSDWTGLPSIAIVHDPLVGEAVQVEGVLYKKTSAILVYGRLLGLLVSVTMILSSLIYALYWFPKSVFTKKIFSTENLVRMPTLLLSVTLLAIPVWLGVSGVDPKLIMQSQTVMFAIFGISSLYPVMVALSLYPLVLYRRSIKSGVLFYYVALLVLTHVFIAIYLGYYGLLGFKVWA
ncbi:serine hydrolase domain-containing protein [Teredinibacter haidensis]|uniref:serine hydrolase domain-containing protein n=1 Tax=Teredinibacter haidensis TaxID=2731755 RepID=UPI0009489A35|nr:serine hydrolase domain-containing protein [Teredinibacter haidensis]